MDYDISDHIIILGWVVEILSYLRIILVVVDIYAPLELQPTFMCNEAVD